MTTSPPRSRGVAPPPRSGSSYPSVQTETSSIHRIRRRGKDAARARILAVLAIAGPATLPQLRDCPRLADLTATQIREGMASLVADGLVEASDRSELAVVDGIRCRRDFTLYSRVRPGGGER